MKENYTQNYLSPTPTFQTARFLTKEKLFKLSFNLISVGKRTSVYVKNHAVSHSSKTNYITL